MIDVTMGEQRREIGQLRAEIEQLKTAEVRASTAYMLATNRNQHYEAEIERLRTEVEQLQAEKTEMADAILQIGGLSEAHFRTLVSFELAEFVFTERLGVLSVEDGSGHA